MTTILLFGAFGKFLRKF